MSFALKEFDSDELDCVPSDVKVLGKGGFGTVVLAFHAIHNVLAIKCFQKVGGERKEKILEKKVKKEFENLQTSNHENVVRVLGWIKNTHVFGIVTEYLPGGNLMELIEDEDVELRSLLKLRICAEVANGLSFIHNFSVERRLIHGDIKPENILLTDYLHCKIGDFGSATISAYTGGLTLTNADGASEKTNTFTEFYAAPEFLKTPLMKPKSSMDTYSYGMMIHVVLGRTMPVNSVSQIEVFKQSILNGQRPHIDDIMDMKRDLEDNGEKNGVRAMKALMSAMDDCWKQEPSERPSMLLVKERLSAVLEEIPPIEILHSVCAAVCKMNVFKPKRKQQNCVPFNHLLLYHPFQQLSTSSHASTTTTSSDASPNVAASRSKFTTDVLPLLASIKSSLEENQVTEAVARTNDLISGGAAIDRAGVIIDDVIALARYLNDKSQPLTSIKLIGWASDICGSIDNAEVKFRKFYRVCLVVDDVSRSMFLADMKLYNEKYCLPLLNKLLEKLKLISIEDTKYKTEKETWCLVYIDRCNNRIGKD